MPQANTLKKRPTYFIKSNIFATPSSDVYYKTKFSKKRTIENI